MFFGQDNFDKIDPDSHIFNALFPGFSSDNISNYYSVQQFNNLDHNFSHISLFNSNVRSFHANGHLFEALFSSLSKLPDLIVLTETWNGPETIDTCRLEGYSAIHTMRTSNRGGGVSVFYDTNWRCEKIENLSVCTETIETCVCRVTFSGSSLIIFAIYRPHSDSIDNFSLCLEQMLQDPIIKNSSKVILVGDFNVNLADQNCSKVQSFKSIMYSFGYLPVITKPTRFPPNIANISGTNLDQIWINNFNPFISGIINLDITDHLPSFLLLNIDVPFHGDSKIKIVSRPFNDRNFSSLQDEISNINWDSILENLDPDQACKVFFTKINDLYCKHFSIKIKYISAKRAANPWLTPEIKKMINKKSEYFKLYKLGIISKRLNNIFKNKVNSTVRRAKNKYFVNAFERSFGDIRKSWEIMKKLLGSSSKKNIIESITCSGIEYFDKADICHQFNEYFGSIAMNLASELPQSDQPFDYLGPPKPNSFYLFDLTLPECSKLISKLKLTSTGLDTMPVRIFKQLNQYLSLPVCKLINLSFRAGVFPDNLKIARITPIFKKGDKKCISNYRPIASLPYLSKIYERAMVNRLFSFINKFSLLSKFQYGFQKNKSTCHALINLTELIFKGLNSKHHVINIFIDLAKAFDTVDHALLLDKLHNYGVRGTSLSWFRSYLNNRIQFVSLGSHSSSQKVINIGVPQGSILGPVLFLIFINDLPSASNILSPTLFADDTTLTAMDSDFENLVPTLNRELELINLWTKNNKLTVNVSKTELLAVSNRHFSHFDHNITLNNQNLTFTDNCMFLGTKLDNRLTFANHIQYITNKLSKSSGIFYKIRENLSRKAKLDYYYAFIFPYISYNIEVWGSTAQCHLNPLVLQQKRFIRLLANADWLAHTTPLFQEYKILKISDVYLYYVSVYVFKAKQQGNFHTEHAYNTRSIDRLPFTFQRLNSTQRSLTFTGPHIWNSLPLHLRNIDTLPKFKKHLKQFLLEKYSDSQI